MLLFSQQDLSILIKHSNVMFIVPKELFSFKFLNKLLYNKSTVENALRPTCLYGKTVGTQQYIKRIMSKYYPKANSVFISLTHWLNPATKKVPFI